MSYQEKQYRDFPLWIKTKSDFLQLQATSEAKSYGSTPVKAKLRSFDKKTFESYNYLNEGENIIPHTQYCGKTFDWILENDPGLL